MKRPFIAGVMGLAIAGCAHSRPELAKGPEGTKPVGPVGLTPVPSLRDTINRGMGDPALAQSALGDPDDSRWSGVAPSPDAIRSGASGSPSPAQSARPPQLTATDSPPTGPGLSQAPPNQPANEPDRLTAQPSPASPPGHDAPEPTDRLAVRPSPSSAPGNQAADGPLDALNPAPTLDAAAAAAAATMPALPSGMADGSTPVGAVPTETVAVPPRPAIAAPGIAMPAAGAGAADGSPPAASVPYTLERPGGPMPGMLARPGGQPATSASPPTDAPGPVAPPTAGPGASDPSGPQLASPSSNGLEPVGAPPSLPAADSPPTRPASAPGDAALHQSGGPAGPEDGIGAPRARTGGDPLLGPNPDLMPELPPLPDADPAPAPAPAGKAPTPPSTPAPAASGAPAGRAGDPPPLGPAPGEAASPAAPAGPGGSDAAPPIASPEPPVGGPPAPPELGPPSAANPPAGAGAPAGAVAVADLPPLEAVPSASQLSGGLLRQTAAPAPAPKTTRRATARRDGQILRASLQKPAAEASESEIPGSWRQASMTAAKVGDEIITVRDLFGVVNEHCKRKRIPFSELTRPQRNELCAGLMKELIDQSLLVQEAKRTIKSPKMYDQFTSQAEQFWRDDQIPQLKTEFAAEDEAQLREKLKEHGRNLDTISLMTRRGWMAEAFLHAKLKDKVKAELPELLKYYNEHIRDKEFDRPAQITWREIVVEPANESRRDEARRKIEAIHQSLRRGADFAALARAQSEGPSRSREQGGLMQTSPGSYGVPSVNAALESLPIGQVSAILEGPSSFHIVRVDGRRAAGPAPFEELQDQIRGKILDKRFQAERVAYLRKLREESIVSTSLEETAGDPGRVAR